jgi:hypothetical protein
MSIEKKIIELCEIHGYGRVMQVASSEWSKKSDSINLSGPNFVIGSFESKVVSCECKYHHNCKWCCGSGWLTNYVKFLKTVSEE